MTENAAESATQTSEPSRFAWARNPEFWIITLLAAVFRLWSLDHSQWLFDQAQLWTIARDAWLFHELPVTGIPSSLGVFNLPLTIYVLMPFSFFTRNPMSALIALALWNVLGVALCYIIALRYFSRRVAWSASLVFACCGATVTFSRFIWQQNFLPPLLLLWAFTLFAGVLQGRRFWLGLHLFLLIAIISLHPTGLALVAVTVVALLIAPHWPTIRDVLLGIGLVALVLIPTLLWEVPTHFPDLHILLQTLHRQSTFNFDVFTAFTRLIGAPTYPNPGRGVYPDLLPTTLYSRLAGANQVFLVVVVLLYIGSYGVLAALALAPIRRVHIAGEIKGWRRVWAWLLTLRQALQADARWRAHLLLWVWITIPPLLMLRHSYPVQAHYLFIIYPALFLSVGIALDTLIRRGPSLLAKVPRLTFDRQRAYRFLAWGALAAVLLVAVGQGIQVTLVLTALSRDEVNYTDFGYPLNQLLAADNELALIQRQQAASNIIVSMPSHYTAQAITSTMIRERSDRTGVYGQCLVLPAPSAKPTLVVSTLGTSPQARLLATLPNAQMVESYTLPGSDPMEIYRVSGTTPLLPGETALPTTTWRDGSGDTLRLIAGAREASGEIRLRWMVDGVSTAAGATITHIGTGTPSFEMRATAANASQPVARATCQPTRLQVGETLYTWMTTAWAATNADLATKSPPLPSGPLFVTALHGTTALYQRIVYRIHYISAADGGEPLAPMSVSGGGSSGGAYELPTSITG